MAAKDEIIAPTDTMTVTVTNGGTISEAAALRGMRLTGIVMPASWTAANITFQGSVDGSTFNDLYDDSGAEVTVVAAASRMIRLVPAEWARVKDIKLRSGTAAATVTQGGDRVLTLMLRPI